MSGVNIIGMFGDDEDTRELAEALQCALQRERAEEGSCKPQVHFVTPDQLPPPHPEGGVKPAVN